MAKAVQSRALATTFLISALSFQAGIKLLNMWKSSLRFDGKPSSLFIKQDPVKVISF